MSPHRFTKESDPVPIPENPTPRAHVKISFEKDALMSMQEKHELLATLES
jgi:hypothetical protein